MKLRIVKEGVISPIPVGTVVDVSTYETRKVDGLIYYEKELNLIKYEYIFMAHSNKAYNEYNMGVPCITKEELLG